MEYEDQWLVSGAILRQKEISLPPLASLFLSGPALNPCSIVTT